MTNMEAAIFYDSYLPAALRRALDYAGEDGFVASLPQLLHARANAPYDNIIWNTWFSSNTEESVVTTPQGNHVVVTVHGGGIFESPERFEKLFRADTNRFNEISFTGLFAGKITERESFDLLDGIMPDGTVIPVFPFDELSQGIKELPRRYGVIMDFDAAKQSSCGYASFDVLREDPVMITRAGGRAAANAYLDKAQARHNTSKMGSWHPFKEIRDIKQPQSTVPALAGNKGGTGSEDDDFHLYGRYSDYGIGADGWTNSTSLVEVARYVAVTTPGVSTGVRNLPFTEG